MIAGSRRETYNARLEKALGMPGKRSGASSATNHSPSAPQLWWAKSISKRPEVNSVAQPSGVALMARSGQPPAMAGPGSAKASPLCSIASLPGEENPSSNPVSYRCCTGVPSGTVVAGATGRQPPAGAEVVVGEAVCVVACLLDVRCPPVARAARPPAMIAQLSVKAAKTRILRRLIGANLRRKRS